LSHSSFTDSVGHVFELEPAKGGTLHNKEPTIIAVMKVLS